MDKKQKRISWLCVALIVLAVLLFIPSISVRGTIRLRVFNGLISGLTGIAFAAGALVVLYVHPNIPHQRGFMIGALVLLVLMIIQTLPYLLIALALVSLVVYMLNPRPKK